MANAYYPKGRQAFGQGDIDWINDDIIVLLVETTTAYNAAHDNINDIANIVQRSDPLSGKSITDGVANASPVVIPSVPSGHNVNAILAKDSGTDSTSPLIMFYDTGSSFPGVTNGEDITFQPEAGSLKFFRL